MKLKTLIAAALAAQVLFMGSPAQAQPVKLHCTKSNGKNAPGITINVSAGAVKRHDGFNVALRITHNGTRVLSASGTNEYGVTATFVLDKSSGRFAATDSFISDDGDPYGGGYHGRCTRALM